METVPVIFSWSLASEETEEETVEEGAASEELEEVFPPFPQLERIRAAMRVAVTIEVTFFIFNSSFLLFTSTLYGVFCQFKSNLRYSFCK